MQLLYTWQILKRFQKWRTDQKKIKNKQIDVDTIFELVVPRTYWTNDLKKQIVQESMQKVKALMTIHFTEDTRLSSTNIFKSFFCFCFFGTFHLIQSTHEPIISISRFWFPDRSFYSIFQLFAWKRKKTKKAKKIN